MFKDIQSKFLGTPQFLFCLLPERKNSDLYGPWKRKNLADFGIVTQCIAPTRVNDQYFTNVLLKINAKVRYSLYGGVISSMRQAFPQFSDYKFGHSETSIPLIFRL
ncbi:Protein argonaute 4 [Camellia lanceoleosa]|uniref:Protein argonaute 4 n=1 Tax=Camellia lanceoleosa TaxID=1840588 RepID=A0ACC0F2A1_9ERIC|nr:Protein argonaute 4 [Camellia lanceoleosa]